MLSKETLERLYKGGFSMMEIAEKERWPYGVVRYWIGKYNIKRRTRSDATYLKRNPEGDPFNIKKKLSKSEIFLKGLGLGIYWGEGDKSIFNTAVRVSNSDPKLLKKFREFLLKICRIKEDKLKYYLILFNDANEKSAINFWKNHLGIKTEQFGRIVKIPPQGKGRYKKKSQFGVLNITFTNKKFFKL